MGSRRMKWAMAGMIVVFLVVFAVIAIVNLDTVKQKLGLAEREPVQEEMTAQEEAVETEDGQIGGDLSAFLRDETFFDPEVKFKSIESYSGRSVSLMMSSVAKDLRIMVVDSVGRLVTGADFTVTIQDVGEYTDNDKDGVIYVDGLRSGEYSVFLNEKDGFRVPNTITTIQVRQDIEYRVLDNIEYLMVTEEDIDPEKEDKAVNSAEEDADGTENMELQFDKGSAKLGIDVSKWNQEINWEAVKDAGVEFAIIRCGYRGATTGALVIDPRYEENIEGAISAGIPVGVYFFTQALDEVEAVEEASMAIDLVKGYGLNYPLFLDVEASGGRADGISRETRTAVCKTFCQTVQNSGITAGIYANKNWFTEKISTGSLTSYKLWLAQYASAPTYTATRYDLWQYSSKGRVSGISTSVDMNISYLNY